MQPDSHSHSGGPAARTRAAAAWRLAARDALRLRRAELAAQRSWVDLDTPTERAQRRDWDVQAQAWRSTLVAVKLEREPFAEGAMRRCHRLLKSTEQPGISAEWAADWRNASAYVAKRYKEDAEAHVYEDDCRMQQEAKAYGARYDALRPPKPVDFLASFLLVMLDRPGLPIFACERMVAGEYVKHNGNDGFVGNTQRLTPNTFSHFTFHASRGELIVVDIQGVGDLYTDPQVHTLDGHGYGAGNLGITGIALFFHAHRCSTLCARLKLPPLPKSELEEEREEQLHAASRDSGEALPEAQASVRPSRSLHTFFDDEGGSVERTPRTPHTPPFRLVRALSATRDEELARESARRTWTMRESLRWLECVQLDRLPAWALQPSVWLLAAPPLEAELRASRSRRLARRLSIYQELAVMESGDCWALYAPVHLQLARMSAAGTTPVLDGVPDEMSAAFHVCYAARGGSVAALRSMRNLCLGKPQELLPRAKLASTLPEVAQALTTALAQAGEADACLELAESAGVDATKLSLLETAVARLGQDVSAATWEQLAWVRRRLGFHTRARDAFLSASDAAGYDGRGSEAQRLRHLADDSSSETV